MAFAPVADVRTFLRTDTPAADTGTDGAKAYAGAEARVPTVPANGAGAPCDGAGAPGDGAGASTSFGATSSGDDAGISIGAGTPAAPEVGADETIGAGAACIISMGAGTATARASIGAGAVWTEPGAGICENGGCSFTGARFGIDGLGLDELGAGGILKIIGAGGTLGARDGTARGTSLYPGGTAMTTSGAEPRIGAGLGAKPCTGKGPGSTAEAIKGAGAVSGAEAPLADTWTCVVSGAGL